MAPLRDLRSVRIQSARVLSGVTVIALLAVGCAGARHPAGGTQPATRGNATAGPPAVVPGFDCATARAATACEAKAAAIDALATSVACAPPPSARARAPRWNHATPPKYLDLVRKRFALGAVELDALSHDGFVVPARLQHAGYVDAYREVHRSQLPVYVSLDSILHAVYASNDSVLAEIESNSLSEKLAATAESMHEHLRSNQTLYTPEIARDLDLYLTVGRLLLKGTPEDELVRDPVEIHAVYGADAEARALVAKAVAARGLEPVALFGRTRIIDFAAFRPRGHYAKAAAQRNPSFVNLAAYFRGAMWFSRLELNLVSRSSRSSSPGVDPRETPREASLALALADLAKRADAMDSIATLDKAWSLLAGPRQDVSLRDVGLLAATAGVHDAGAADAPAKLRAVIGDRFVRTARTHVQAEPSPQLPVIASLLGPRITPDTTATRPLAHPAVPSRFEVPAIEMAYALGHDRALTYLARDLAAFPALRPQLDRARDVVFGRATWEGQPAPKGTPEAKMSLYSAWFEAVKGIAERSEGGTPSFMEGEAYVDMRLASAVAAYAQIRHNYVLLVPTTYDEGGCAIPDGYVEPAPAVYRELIAYAARGEQVMRELEDGSAEYFARLGRMLRVLSRIADRELANEPLRDDERLFLSMIAEETRWETDGYSGHPVYDGWYYGMHREVGDALEDASLVTDFFASTNSGGVDYAGVRGTSLGIFVIDTGGEPRLAVGPVTRAFQAHATTSRRFSDDEIDRLDAKAPWDAGYVTQAPKAPAFKVRAVPNEGGEGITLEATSSTNLERVTIALLDHHREAIVSETREVRGNPGRVAKARWEFARYDAKQDVAKFGVEGVRITVGAFDYVDGDVTQYELEAGDDVSWTFTPNGPLPASHSGRRSSADGRKPHAARGKRL